MNYDDLLLSFLHNFYVLWYSSQQYYNNWIIHHSYLKMTTSPWVSQWYFHSCNQESKSKGMNLDHVVYFCFKSYNLCLPSGSSSYYKNFKCWRNRKTLHFSMILPWEKLIHKNNKTDCLVIYTAPICNMQLCPFPESLLINTTHALWVFFAEYGVKNRPITYTKSQYSLKTKLAEF